VIDYCIRLNELTDRGLTQIAPKGADDPRRHATRQSKSISDGQNAIANAHLIAVAEPSGGQWSSNIDLDDRQIDPPQPFAEQAGFSRGSIMEPHLNLVSALNHVPVGYDQPCRISDDPGADKINDDRSIESLAASVIIGGIDHPLTRDPDDRGHDRFNHIGE
jgi:hypothetical protein